MRQNLCLALALHAGQQLTPEVGVAIVRMVHGEDRPQPLEHFPVLERGAYRVAVERFADVRGELVALHDAHWLETEKYRHGLPYAPDLDAMQALDEAGRCLQFTVRTQADGQLVGHLRMFLARSMHTRTWYAEEDSLYLLPEHRGGFLAMALMKHAERCLWSLEAPRILEIRTNSKLATRREGGPSAAVLMERMGYPPTALQHTKFRPKESTDVQ